LHHLPAAHQPHPLDRMGAKGNNIDAEMLQIHRCFNADELAAYFCRGRCLALQ
jgi:hypothetical protein